MARPRDYECFLLMAVDAKGLKVLSWWENRKEAGESGTTTQ